MGPARIYRDLTWGQALYAMQELGWEVTRSAFVPIGFAGGLSFSGNRRYHADGEIVFVRNGPGMVETDGSRVVTAADLGVHDIEATDWWASDPQTPETVYTLPECECLCGAAESEVETVDVSVGNLVNLFVGWGDPHWELIHGSACGSVAMSWDDNVADDEILAAYAEDGGGNWWAVHLTMAAFGPSLYVISQVRVEYDIGGGVVTNTVGLADSSSDPTIPQLNGLSVAFLRVVNQGTYLNVGFCWLYGAEEAAGLGGGLYFAQERFIAGNGRLLLNPGGPGVDGWGTIMATHGVTRADLSAASASGSVVSAAWRKVTRVPSRGFFRRMVAAMDAAKTGLVAAPSFEFDPLPREDCSSWVIDPALVLGWASEVPDEIYPES